MPFGTLYTYRGGPRSIGIFAAAHALGLEIDIVETQNHPQRGVPKAYLELNPLGKTPTFVGEDGFVLSECIAIALHVTLQAPKSSLMGSDEREYVQIVKWMSYTNTDVVSRVAGWVRPLVGYTPYHREGVEAAKRATEIAISVFEKHLGHGDAAQQDHTSGIDHCSRSGRRYLVGGQLTLADLMCAGLVSFGFAKVFDREWRQRHPHFARWYADITAHDVFKAVVPRTEMIDVGLHNEAPKGKLPTPVITVHGQRDEADAVEGTSLVSEDARMAE